MCNGYISSPHVQRPWHLASALPFIPVSLSQSCCWYILQIPCIRDTFLIQLSLLQSESDCLFVGERDDSVEPHRPKPRRAQSRQKMQTKEEGQDWVWPGLRSPSPMEDLVWLGGPADKLALCDSRRAVLLLLPPSPMGPTHPIWCFK